MRFKLDPSSSSGISVDEPKARTQSPGYIGEVKLSGLLSAGTNITLTGGGTKQSPYIINSTGGGGGGSSTTLTAADGTTVTAETQASNFGAGLAIVPGTGTDANIVGANNLNFYAAGASDGTGAFTPSLSLGEGGNIIIDTSNAATAGSNTIYMKATDGFAVTTDGVNNGYISPAGITANRTLTFPDADGTIATQAYVAANVLTRSVNVISTNTSAGSTARTDYIYIVTATATLTLPTAVGSTSLYRIKNSGSGTVTVATTSSQTIDGGSTASLPVQYTSIDLISDGSNWAVI